MTHPLRDYQVEAVASVRAAWLWGARRVLLVMPTGGGKTRTAVEVVAAARAKGRKILWLTHRVEIVTQASAQLAALGVDHGVILAGRPRRADLPMQVASVQTLTAGSAADRPDDVNVVIVDEAHHVTARTWRALIEAYPRLELVLGLTATPQRGDGAPLGDIFERMVVACSVAELQRRGSLVPCDVFAAREPTKHLSEDPVLAYRRHAAGKRAIVFAQTVAEAHRLARAFNAGGITAEAIEGSTEKADRAGALERLAAGQTLVVVNVMCLTEGADIPAIECVILARGCTTDGAFMQMVGRGLRPSPSTGKTRCVVIDLRGAVHEHGLPSDPRVFSLLGAASRVVTSDAAPLPPCVQCRACLAWGRGGACAACGARLPAPPPPKVSKRELSLIRATNAASRAATSGSSEWVEWCDHVQSRRARGKTPQAIAFAWRMSRTPPRALRFRVDQVPASGYQPVLSSGRRASGQAVGA